VLTARPPPEGDLMSSTFCLPPLAVAPDQDSHFGSRIHGDTIASAAC